MSMKLTDEQTLRGNRGERSGVSCQVPAVSAVRTVNWSIRVMGALAAAALAPVTLAAQTPRTLMPIEFTNSAEFGWLNKRVHASRMLDDMRDSSGWRFTGSGRLSFPAEPRLDGMRVLRVDMQLFANATAPTGARLPAINLQRRVAGEDWREYNRISLWIRAEASGFPTVPIQIVL